MRRFGPVANESAEWAVASLWAEDAPVCGVTNDENAPDQHRGSGTSVAGFLRCHSFHLMKPDSPAMARGRAIQLSRETIAAYPS